MKAQKRPLSYPFQNFLKRIMSDSLEEHDGKVSPGGRPVTNPQFADDFDVFEWKSRSFCKRDGTVKCSLVLILTLKDSLPYLFHRFRNRRFNKISLDNVLYFHNKVYTF